MKIKNISFLMLMSSPSILAASLDEVIQSSLFQNPSVKQAYDNYVNRTHLIDQAKAGYLPVIDSVAGVGNERMKYEGNDRTSMTRSELGLTLSQMIFDGMNTSNNVDRTKSEAEAQKYTLISQASNTALQVAQSYLDVLRYQELLELAKGNLVTHEAILADIEKRTQSGVGSSADLVQTRGRVSQARSNVVAAQNNLSDAESTYTRYTNLQAEHLSQPVPDLSLIKGDLDTVKDFALKHHPVLVSAENDILATQHQYEASKSNFYPHVALEAYQYRYNNADQVDGTLNSSQIMLRVRYNLFNGGADIAQKRATAAQIAEAKDIRMEATRETVEGLSLAWHARDALKQQKEFMQSHVVSSNDTVLAYRKQFLLGNRSLLDVLNTENELFEARQNVINATYDQLYADYRVLNASGALLDSIHFKQPQEWN